ncbi:MAG TPA: hypothetical protein VFX16_05980 [Pseudonocardiaceae bacterium]|nr:hypothetical protein [Pseudonocardiaceae bacterium]
MATSIAELITALRGVLQQITIGGRELDKATATWTEAARAYQVVTTPSFQPAGRSASIAGTTGCLTSTCTASACGIHGAIEVPIELVFEAVAEVVGTRQRPTCLDWVAIDHREHRLIGGQDDDTPMTLPTGQHLRGYQPYV